ARHAVENFSDFFVHHIDSSIDQPRRNEGRQFFFTPLLHLFVSSFLRFFAVGFRFFCIPYIFLISATVVASSGVLSSRMNPTTRGKRSASPEPLLSSAQVLTGERVISSASTVITYRGSTQTSGSRRESTRGGLSSAAA